MSAEEAEIVSEVFWYVAILGGILLIAGLIGEFPESDNWKKRLLYKLSKIAVIIGVGGELIADSAIFKVAEREQQIVNQFIQSNLDIQKAMLGQLLPRGDMSMEKMSALIDAFKEVKPTLNGVVVFTILDAETENFGQTIMYALRKADVDFKWGRINSFTPPEIPGVPLSTIGITFIKAGDANLCKELSPVSAALEMGFGCPAVSNSDAHLPPIAMFVMLKGVPFQRMLPRYENVPDFKPIPPAWEAK